MKNIIKFVRTSNRPLILTIILIYKLLCIPAVICHELSHLFFLLLFGARFKINNFAFFKVSEDGSEINNNELNITYISNDIVAIIISFAPNMFLFIYVVISLALIAFSHYWALLILFYCGFAFKMFTMSKVDYDCFKQSYDNLKAKKATLKQWESVLLKKKCNQNRK